MSEDINVMLKEVDVQKEQLSAILKILLNKI